MKQNESFHSPSCSICFASTAWPVAAGRDSRPHENELRQESKGETEVEPPCRSKMGVPIEGAGIEGPLSIPILFPSFRFFPSPRLESHACRFLLACWLVRFVEAYIPWLVSSSPSGTGPIAFSLSGVGRVRFPFERDGIGTGISMGMESVCPIRFLFPSPSTCRMRRHAKVDDAHAVHLRWNGVPARPNAEDGGSTCMAGLPPVPPRVSVLVGRHRGGRGPVGIRRAQRDRLLQGRGIRALR